MCVWICNWPCTRVLSGSIRVWLSVTLWTMACQAPLSMGFSRQEYGSGLPCPPPGNLPNPGIKPTSPVSLALQVDSLLSHLGSPHDLLQALFIVLGVGINKQFSEALVFNEIYVSVILKKYFCIFHYGSEICIIYHYWIYVIITK